MQFEFLWFYFKNFGHFCIIHEMFKYHMHTYVQVTPSPLPPQQKNIKATAQNVYKNSTKFTTISPINS